MNTPLQEQKEEKTKEDLMDAYSERADYYCDHVRVLGLVDASKVLTIYANQEKRKEAIAFANWREKLSPVQRCTVWPPAGSGSGTGLYEKSDEDIYDSYLDSLKNQSK